MKHMSARYPQQLALDFDTSPNKNAQMPGRTSLIQKGGQSSSGLKNETVLNVVSEHFGQSGEPKKVDESFESSRTFSQKNGDMSDRSP